ncbi:MAG: indolepyruvate oxidoreductase subunit beta [Phycisphaerales bacterium]|nr:indolepyruvate oxidoreductase subunit beta [Phycisphaerales bacterium]
MEHNLILAGVGGQGILTIARAISAAALQRNLHVRQAEVHGMSQRGGAVQSHLRVADHELFSDLIPLGQVDMILAVEPLEALRYVHYLRPTGVLVVSTNAFMNIDNYPAIEQVLDRIAGFERHVLLDVDRLAKVAGSPLAANIVTLGAGALFLEIDAQELEDAVAEMFAAKGDKVVGINRRAFRLGRAAAAAYRDGLQRGGTSRAVRAWIDRLDAEALLAAEPPTPPSFDDLAAVENRLTGAEATAFERTLLRAYQENRRALYEHEVYVLIELIGAISPPRYVFVPTGNLLAREALATFPGERVVLKIVSPEVVHKTDAQGVVFCPKEYDIVRREMDRLVARQAAHAPVEGVLVVEYVESRGSGFGSELFVGVRATREFGPVIAAGLGGIDTEYLAQRMRPGIAVAKACAADTSAEEFLELFKRTAAYDLLAGRARGHDRIVSDGELLRCFRAFISLARHFCVDRGAEGPDVAELEVNPFAFRQQRMVPLDGRGRLGTAAPHPVPRPAQRIVKLLEPGAIAVLGASATAENFGRIIARNVRDGGFPCEHLYLVKEGLGELDGIRCVPTLEALPEPVDLLVVAVPAPALPEVVRSATASGKVGAALLIPGGVGETEAGAVLDQELRAAIAAARQRPDGGPVFIGPNCMGIQSRPGRYDTFFIPRSKLDPRWEAPPRRVALISQSGAFVITRQSNLGMLDAALAISLGNQIDVTLADVAAAAGSRTDIDVVAIYAEGFGNYDGLELVRHIRRMVADGKFVLFYKAGRTPSGRSAAAGHTAAVAGDYDVCLAAVANAGAVCVDTFSAFEQLLDLATALHTRTLGGLRVAALSNAGFETVGMADATVGDDYAIQMTALSDTTQTRLTEILHAHKLTGLVNARNPLDVTPMATDAAYAAALGVLLQAPEVDAVIAALVPLTPAMLTTAEELSRPGALPERLAELLRHTTKPVVCSVAAGRAYDPLVAALRRTGVPVFRSADEATRVLGRYLWARAAAGTTSGTDLPAATRTAEQPLRA